MDEQLHSVRHPLRLGHGTTRKYTTPDAAAGIRRVRRAGSNAGGGYSSADLPIRVLTVCTGNVCRSPLAAAVLATRLAPLDIEVGSAGTHALVGSNMTDQTVELARAHGVDAKAAARHRAHQVSEPILADADLVLAMSLDHRRRVVELLPRLVRSTFTVREFSRLANDLGTEELHGAMNGEAEPRARLRRALDRLIAQRAVSHPPADGGMDDVVDPYGRSPRTYEAMNAQLIPALDNVERVLRAVFFSD